MSKGKHQITCELTDPELRTKRKCSYTIHIEESSDPYPHPDDCKNQTVFANKKGTIHSKPVRFLVNIGKPSRIHVIRGSCKPKGDLEIGSHLVACKAIYPPTNSTGSCSYWLKVKERTCPPLVPIPNAEIICETQTVGSVCYYECNAGYTFPDNQLIRSVKTCQSNLKWQPAWSPVCEIETPKLEEGCEDLEINSTAPVYFVVPQPKFSTTLNQTLNVSCFPPDIRKTGEHLVSCEVDDDIFNSSCNFKVNIILVNQTVTLPSEDENPELVEGCEDLEVNVTSPVNFTIPLPRYLSPLKKSLDTYCEPSYVTSIGHHAVKCTVDSVAFDESCYFNLTVQFESQITTYPASNDVETPAFVEGCSDFETNVSLPINYFVPFPYYFNPQNETIIANCMPSLIIDIGQHHVECFFENLTTNYSCSFNVTVQLTDEVISSAKPQKAELPKLVRGCYDLEVDVSPPFNFSVPIPQYLTTENVTLEATCIPSFISSTGLHKVKCLVDNVAFQDLNCTFNVTVSLDETTPPPAPATSSCKPLSPPMHGSIQCSTQEQTETCHVTCDLGYGFSDDYTFTAVCDGGSDGLWDFQKLNTNGSLPECFAMVDGSAVEVWISFEAFAPHCEEELQEQMRDIVDHLCQTDANCSKFDVNCTLDEESDMMVVSVNWTVQADFNTGDYLEHEEIPEAETRIETVLERARAFLATEDAPAGVHLFRDSFRRGLMTLVCPNGFTPDMMMSNCVQSPTDISRSEK